MENPTDPSCGCGDAVGPSPGAGASAEGASPHVRREVESTSQSGPRFEDPTQNTRTLSLVRDRATIAAVLPWLRPALYGPRRDRAAEDPAVPAKAKHRRPMPEVQDKQGQGSHGVVGAPRSFEEEWAEFGLPDRPDVPIDPVPDDDEPDDDGEPDYTVSPPIQSCAGRLPGENVEEDGEYFTLPFLPTFRTHKVGASLLSSAEQGALDTIMATHMGSAQMPNGMLAIVEADGRLVHCFGYTNVGLFDTIGEPRFYAGPHTAFRIGSVSKTITAWTVQKLIDLNFVQRWHKLSTYVDLDRVPAPVENFEVPEVVLRSVDAMGIFGDATIKVEEIELDDRRDHISLQQLLTHTAGWFDDQLEATDSVPPMANKVWSIAAGEPVEYSDLAANPGMIGTTISHLHQEMAEANRASWPVTHDHMLRYMNLWPLAFDPGSTYSYSNWGYWMLGRVIEAATCRRYDAVVDSLLLRPLDMRNTRLGLSRKADRGVDEAPVFSVEWPTASTETQSYSQSYDDGSGDYRGNDYAEYDAYARRQLNAEDAPGGWLSTAFDLALYLRETFHVQSLMSADLYTEMLSPLVPTEQEAAGSTYCGYGWSYGRSERPGCHYKTGHILGGRAYVFNQGAGGRSLVYAFNREPMSDDTDLNSDLESQFRHDVLDALDAISTSFPGPFAPPDLFTRLQQ